MMRFAKSLVLRAQQKTLAAGPVRDQLRALSGTSSTYPPWLANNLHSYDLGSQSAPDSAEERGPIFVTSRFRSGSTLLWNLLRQTPGITSFYEPFNERRWFDADGRGDRVDGTHRGVADYWTEYEGLEALGQWYEEDWIRHRLLMDRTCKDDRMFAFVAHLIAQAHGRAALQFNRIDFRLDWFVAHFPGCKLIHLFRHPRDQWCSFLTDKKQMSADRVADTYTDAFYLDVWCRDLEFHFPFLSRAVSPHPYQRFYLL